MEAINEMLVGLEENVLRILDHGEITRTMLGGIARRADENFFKIDERFDNVEKRFIKINEQLDKMDERFDRIDERLDKMEGRLDKMDGRLDKMDGRLDKMDERFDRMDERFNKIETKLNVLTNETSNSFIEVFAQLGGINAEIIKIGAATRYQQYHEDQMKFNINN
ncbi:hypothetical protein AQ505_18720 [Pedobacter sp. PACM 27299]|uniref:coiled-coil domain-containing protein n=1 Tax=Pedobacter sp. PACM 27299 TaxID=1727164 RepID=UPI0007068EC3|nr:hypothetical protein [Pedobacter sp. PACM 27299]ALL07341.1 hypothetical protein AQ505_18720 [Pedobacter sp. PACM 27299]